MVGGTFLRFTVARLTLSPIWYYRSPRVLLSILVVIYGLLLCVDFTLTDVVGCVDLPATDWLHCAFGLDAVIPVAFGYVTGGCFRCWRYARCRLHSAFGCPDSGYSYTADCRLFVDITVGYVEINCRLRLLVTVGCLFAIADAFVPRVGPTSLDCPTLPRWLPAVPVARFAAHAPLPPHGCVRVPRCRYDLIARLRCTIADLRCCYVVDCR